MRSRVSPDLTPGQGVYAINLADFWGIDRQGREAMLLDAIVECHAWHFERNPAYRLTVAARGVGPELGGGNGSRDVRPVLPRLLRPTAQTFKSYIDVLGTPFAQDRPREFVEWLADQLSIDLPRERVSRFRRRYRSLESLLREIESVYSDLGLEISTSSGTSGHSTILARDQDGMDKTVESFYLCFQRHLGMKADHRAIFIMPRQTRIAMARMASFSVQRVGLSDDRVHFAIPFPAEPDQVRIRAGRTLRRGWRGLVEGKLAGPFMGWMQDRVVTPQAVRRTIALLKQAASLKEKVLVFGGWVQLHAIAQALRSAGESLHLAPGSIVGSGGGLKELYPFRPVQIRDELGQVMVMGDGQPLEVRDTYGMAEGNWAAMQCSEGSYHLPPWLYSVTMDGQGEFQEGPDTTGLLAFFDPYGGGNLFPAFFRTADRVRLVNGSLGFDPVRSCRCGDDSAYLARESIQRVDLLDEAGCAAQV